MGPIGRQLLLSPHIRQNGRDGKDHAETPGIRLNVPIQLASC